MSDDDGGTLSQSWNLKVIRTEWRIDDIQTTTRVPQSNYCLMKMLFGCLILFKEWMESFLFLYEFIANDFLLLGGAHKKSLGSGERLIRKICKGSLLIKGLYFLIADFSNTSNWWCCPKRDGLLLLFHAGHSSMSARGIYGCTRTGFICSIIDKDKWDQDKLMKSEKTYAIIQIEGNAMDKVTMKRRKMRWTQRE